MEPGRAQDSAFFLSSRWVPPSYITPISRVLTPVTHLFLAMYKRPVTPCVTRSRPPCSNLAWFHAQAPIRQMIRCKKASSPDIPKNRAAFREVRCKKLMKDDEGISINKCVSIKMIITDNLWWFVIYVHQKYIWFCLSWYYDHYWFFAYNLYYVSWSFNSASQST